MKSVIFKNAVFESDIFASIYIRGSRSVRNALCVGGGLSRFFVAENVFCASVVAACVFEFDVSYADTAAIGVFIGFAADIDKGMYFGSVAEIFSKSPFSGI